MIKSDYGHINYPFYEQKLDNGLKVIFIPYDGVNESAIVYLSQGGYLHSSKILSSKIPFGTSYYVEKMIMNDEFKDELKKLDTDSYSASDYSYTCFQVTKKDDIFTPLTLLMNRLSSMRFDEEELDKIKSVTHLPKTAYDVTKRRLLNNLYFSSPIKNGYVPDEKESVLIHTTALKKFMSHYYVPPRVTLIILASLAPSEVIEKVKKLPLPSNAPTYSEELVFDEDYAHVKEEFETIEGEDDILMYGVKFCRREELFEHFGQLLFYSYEVLCDCLFNKNEEFQKGVYKVGADFLKAELLEGGEDTSLLLTFKTKRSVALLSFLTDYFSDLSKRIDSKRFTEIVDNYYVRSLANLSRPKDTIRNFARSYANNFPYTALLVSTSKMNFKSYKELLKEISKFPKASVQMKKI